MPPHIPVLIDNEINVENEYFIIQKADKIYSKFTSDKKSVNAILPPSEVKRNEILVSETLEKFFDNKCDKLCNSIARSRLDKFYNDENKSDRNSHSNRSCSRDSVRTSWRNTLINLHIFSPSKSSSGHFTYLAILRVK